MAEGILITVSALSGYALGVVVTLIAVAIGHWIARTDKSARSMEKRKEEEWT